MSRMVELADPSDIQRQAGTIATAVFDRLLASVGEDLRPRWRAEPSPGPAQDDEAVLLEAGPGTVAKGRIWLHNTSGTALLRVRLSLTELVGTRGRLDGSTATIRPARVDVPAEDSAPVVIRVPVPPDTAPGMYHGQVRSECPPAEVAVRLVVRG